MDTVGATVVVVEPDVEPEPLLVDEVDAPAAPPPQAANESEAAITRLAAANRLIGAARRTVL
ncbi:hypothetical protein [Derxia lacustris]|uniref:hypothetical protein n=1 Tax=Derxia lacustris TaxID=764842 RepID=UPI00111C1600|nr:hypothetical protein [Derxia lacustris]